MDAEGGKKERAPLQGGCFSYHRVVTSHACAIDDLNSVSVECVETPLGAGLKFRVV